MSGTGSSRWGALRRLSLAGIGVALVGLAGCHADTPAPVSVSTPSHKRPVAPVPALRDMAYGQDPRQVLDLYLPEGRRPAPLVLYIHGGRWLRGGKEQALDYGRVDAMLAAGFAVATINYRYSTTAIWPAQQDDVLAAIGWLRTQAKAQGIDAKRLAIWGQSSGAHMALMTAARLVQDKDASLQAVIAWFAPSDLARLRQDRIDDAVPGGYEDGQKPAPESLLIGAPVETSPALADAASPAVVLAGLAPQVQLPPILLVHGTADPLVSPLQTERLYRLLQARPDSEVQLREVTDGSHGGPGFDAETSPSVAFLMERLRR